MKRVFSWTFVLLFASTGLAAGQTSTTAAISGTVTDSTEAVLPGVVITVTNEEGAKTFVSGRSGRYLAPFLTPEGRAATVRLGERPVGKVHFIKLDSHIYLRRT